MEESGFEEIRVYITRRKNTVAQYIATLPILNLCDQSVWRPGAWVSWRWWDQEGLELEGERERVATALDGEEDNCVEGADHDEMIGRS